MTNGNDSAHPVIASEYGAEWEHGIEKPFTNTYSFGGLTKREYFAAMIMQGLLSDSRNIAIAADAGGVDALAVRWADLLIKQLNGETET